MDRNKLFEWCISAGFTAEHVNEYERAFEALVKLTAEREREAMVVEAAKQGWAMKNEDPFEDSVRDIADMLARGVK